MKLAAVGGASFATEKGLKKVGKLVPYVVPPENVSPIAWTGLATTCRECPAGCGMHVRHINGRIIKAEGNPEHPVNRGGLCPRGQSALQGIYDPDRLKEIQTRERTGPFRRESRDTALARIGEWIRKANGRIAIMSRVETGTLSEIMSSFISIFKSNRLLFYEPFHYGPLRKAHAAVHGLANIPYYNLGQCDYIISFGADFLESWISNVQYAYEFSNMHAFRNGSIGRFDYVGPRLSMTAANADRFIPVHPGREKDVALAMLRIMSDENMLRTGAELIKPLVAGIDVRSVVSPSLSETELRLMARRFSKSRSLALAGPVGAIGREAEELAVAAALLNIAAGSAGSIIDFSRTHALSGAADEDQFMAFLKSITRDDVLIVHKTNPVFTRPGCEELLGNAGLIVYLGTMMDETAAIADWVVPVNDDLESWGEYEPWTGVRGLMQPTMTPLTDSMDTGDLFIKIAATAQKVLRRKPDGSPIETTYDWLRNRWNSRSASVNWEEAVRRGGSWSSPAATKSKTAAPVKTGISLLPGTRNSASPMQEDEAYLWLWSSIMLFDGRAANRGWLQEAPEPISTITWGNSIDLHPRKAQLLKIRSGDVIEIATRDGRSIQAPARVTEDVAEEVAAVCFGQGHSAIGSIAANVGVNAFKLLSRGEPLNGSFGRVKIRKTGRTEEPAKSMTTSDQHDREILQWKHLDEARSMKPGPLILPLAESYAKGRDLYKPHEHKKHRWAMTIDLQRCIGCGACAVACYAENNIPVVGRKQVMKGRHIPWLRVVPYRLHDHPHRVGWLPMLCQHCDQAPCEPVCPVFAAAHNEDGLNAQIYNRCIGTRYCSNNCPYKVRRFNWVNIEWDKSLTWQLNPEVTVRVRGVMEKCTFCVQRIRNAEYRAKLRKQEGPGRRDRSRHARRPARQKSSPSATCWTRNQP